jgi:RHS repeat-associated protein
MTYHLYHDGQRIVEERNGSDLVIRQYVPEGPQAVWGRDYVDELCQIGINHDPADANEGPGGNQCLCDSFYYGLHDPMYNVIGLVNSTGALVERYEYTPYGQRTVFISPGASDSLCMSPVLESRRVTVIGTAQPYGFCDVGHQGLFFDKEFGLVHNRARMLHPALGRFMQRDPIGYRDGMNLSVCLRGNPVVLRDPEGTGCASGPCSQPTGDTARACCKYSIQESAFSETSVWIGGEPTYWRTVARRQAEVANEHKYPSHRLVCKCAREFESQDLRVVIDDSDWGKCCWCQMWVERDVPSPLGFGPLYGAHARLVISCEKWHVTYQAFGTVNVGWDKINASAGDKPKLPVLFIDWQGGVEGVVDPAYPVVSIDCDTANSAKAALLPLANQKKFYFEGLYDCRDWAWEMYKRILAVAYTPEN